MSACRNLLRLVAPILLASIGAQAQAGRLNRNVASLELKLKASSGKVCMQSLLPLELEITNHTNSNVEIVELYVLRNYTIEFIRDDESLNLVGSLGIWPGTIPEEKRLRDEVHLLKPGETYTTTYKLSLWDLRAFSQPGKYSLRTYYKQMAASNSASFEITNCKSN